MDSELGVVRCRHAAAPWGRNGQGQPEMRSGPEPGVQSGGQHGQAETGIVGSVYAKKRRSAFAVAVAALILLCGGN